MRSPYHLKTNSWGCRYDEFIIFLKRLLVSVSILSGVYSGVARSQNFEYSETFVNSQTYCAGSSQYDNWKTFRNSLDTTSHNFISVTFSGSLNTTGVTCSTISKVRQIASALKTGTDVTINCNGVDWTVGTGCGSGCGAGSSSADAVELNANNTARECYCDVGPILRPAIGNSNWGGMGSVSCSAPTQTMTVKFVATTAPDDAGVSSIDSPHVFCPGTHNIYANIVNYGINQIDTVTVNWSLNGTVQTAVLYTDTLDTFGGVGSTSALVLLGSHIFTAGVPVVIKVWTSSPNNNTDTVNFNDTMEVVRMPALSGTYTIGGTSPDYPSFSAAVNDLTFAGVCGAVEFEVHDSTFIEQLAFGIIPGASSTNTITFRSASGDSSTCVLNYPSFDSDSNWTVLFKGGSHIAFEKITLGAISSSYGRVIEIRDNSYDISFSNCVIAGVSTSSSSTHFALVYSSGFKNDSLIWLNNKFLDGSYAFYLTGGGTTVREYGLRIVGNLLIEQYYSGIYLAYQESPEIVGNLIHSSSLYPYGFGIYNYYVLGDFLISNNRILRPNLAHVLYFYACFADSTHRGRVVNNFLRGGDAMTTAVVNGIYISSSSYIDFIFNNINLTSGYPESYVFRDDFSSNIRLLNNNFVNQGEGYVIYLEDTNALSVSDHNNLFGRVAPLFHWDNNLDNLSNWKAVSGHDDHSFEADPFYLGITDLHVRQPLLKHAGMPVAGIFHDIDGEPRDTTRPDIGADEFILPPVDAGLLSIDSPATPFASGTRDIWITLINGGTDTLTTDSLGWKINGSAKPSYFWSGTLLTGKVDSILLGSHSFTGAKRDTLMIWTFAPNGGIDTTNFNDTLIKILAPALAGIYTIGGSSPDFPDFSAAVDALNSGGVSGPVTFEVRDGSYTEQIVIDNIQGISAANTVTFQSENGDSSLVTLQYATNSSENYVVQLREANWISFKQITLKTLSTTYAQVVTIVDGGHDLQFSNCVFEGSTSTSTTSVNAIFRGMYEALDSNLKITKCIFKNGSSAIWLEGHYYQQNPGVEIDKCIIDGAVRYGIYFEYIDSPLINGNSFSPRGNNTFYGVYLYYCNSFDIKGNDFKTNNSGYGIYLEDCNSDSTHPSVLANNFIHIGNSYGNGIYAEYSDYLGIYFNSILNEVSSSGYSAFYFYSCDAVLLMNNIASAPNGAGAIISEGGTEIISCDYNDYNVTGSPFGEYDYINYSTFSAWKTGTGFDSNSVAHNPLFKSNADLHTTNIQLRNIAHPIDGIRNDIDGEIRDSLAPDIGADEFPLPPLDGSLAGFVSPQMPFSPGSQSIIAIVLNAGSDTLDSVTVGWTINGVAQTPVKWYGQLFSGDTVHLNLGSHFFSKGSGVSLEAWTSMPNGMTDPLTTNDTFLLDNLYPGLSGTYTIGGVSPDFSNFNAAVTALNQGGVYGWVVFDVRDSNYNEQLEINEIVGASSTNTITFQSQSGDTSTVRLFFSNTSSNNYIVHLNGADFIEFKNITLEAIGYYSRVFWLNNNAESNSIWGCQIIVPVISSTSTSFCPILLDYSDENSNNKIINNHIEGGSTAIYLYGLYNGRSQNILINNNWIENQYYQGIYGEYEYDLVISGNTIGNRYGNYSGYYAIRLEDSRDELKVTGNKLNVGDGNYGIYMYDHETNIGRGLIANNFISGSGDPDIYGMLLYYLENVDIIHNSINLTPDSTSSGSGLTIYYGSGNTVQNNIISSTGGDASYYLYSLFSVTKSDYNNIYSANSSLANYGSDYYTLNSWTNATALDSHSVSVLPVFLSNTDLHTNNIALNERGNYFSNVPLDIDGDTRSTTAPDLGADEFNASPQDAAVLSLISPMKPFLADTYNVTVLILNNGTNDIDSVTINWTVNDTAQAAYKWTGTLASGDTTSVSIGSFIFNDGISHNLKIWTSSPNGGIDTVNNNDTLQVKELYAALLGTYTIGGIAPDFANFTDAVIALRKGGIAGNVIFDVRNGTYNEQIEFASIPGASATSTVIFQSENSDSSLVELSFSANHNDSNYTIKFDQASYVTFKDMTVKATNNTYGRTIFITGNSHHLSFLNNQLIGVDINTTSFNYTVVDIAGTYDSALIFVKNLIQYGSVGLNFIGTSSLGQSDMLISGNYFLDQYYLGVYMTYGDAPIISKNTIKPKSIYGSFYGIYLTDCRNEVQILGNWINGNNIRYGIAIFYSHGTSSKRMLVANNFAVSGGGSSGRPLYIYSSSYIDVYNNSFHEDGSSSSGYAAYIYSSSSIRMLNNLLINSAGGYAFYTSTTLDASDYNDFFTSGSTLAYWAGTSYTTLSSMQSGTGMDASSVSIDPRFVTPLDLHVQESLLNGIGFFLSMVPEDIDGEPRDSLSPDIGADEFNTFPNDAGVASIDSPATGFMAGVHNIWATLKNYGSDTLFTVTIDWTLNGSSQTTINWSDTLLPEDSMLVQLGQSSFQVSSGVDVVAWTSQPNGHVDGSQFNDTAKWLNIYPALSGIYTIGGTSPDFTDFSAAVDALNYGGVSGAVIFKARNGVYNEQLQITSVTGASSSNTITFESENLDSSLVTISYSAGSSNNYVLYLKGAKYITFRKLGIKTTSSNYGRVIWLSDKCENVSFRNNWIVGNNGVYYYYYPILIHAGYLSQTKNLEIENNHLELGNYGIYCEGYNYSNPEAGLKIIGNEFEDQYYYGAYLRYQASPQFLRNVMSSSRGYQNHNNIYLYYPNGLPVITANKIDNEDGNIGLYLVGYSGNFSNRASIFNNFISVAGNNYSRSLWLASNNYVNIYHNSLHVYGDDSLNSRALEISNSTGIYLENNNIINSTGAYAIYTGTNIFGNSDYNNLYTSGSKLGYYNGNISNLAGWQSATGEDGNSLSLDPFYISNSNLHARQTGLNDMGTPISAVSTDIDGDPRSTTTPDIGADEFNPVNKDVGVASVITPISGCGYSSAEQVTVRIKNYGFQAQSNFDVTFIKDNGTPVTENIGSDTIQPGDYYDFTFSATVNIASQATYNFVFYTSLANDSVATNDTLKLAVTNYPPFHPTVISDTSVCYGNYVWLYATGGSSYYWSTGSTSYAIYANPADTTTYTVKIVNSNGCKVTDTIVVDVLPIPVKPVITVNGNDTICFGDSVQLISSVTSNIIWNNNATTTSIYASNSGSYWVKETNQLGCSNTSNSQTIKELPLPTISNSQSLGLCPGDTATLTVNNGSSYSWSTGQSTKSISVNPPDDSTYTVTITNAIGCMYYDSVMVDVLFLNQPGVVSNMIPIDSAADITLPVALSWFPAVEATHYDVYLWPDSLMMPSIPHASNISAISEVIYSGLNPGVMYSWLIGSKNACKDTLGPVQRFTLRDLPDLIVQSVSLPSSAFSGQSISISWQVKNTGKGATGSTTWYDAVYLSSDTTFEKNTDTYLGAIPNSSSLSPNSSYSQNSSFTLPHGISGNYYVFVVTNTYNQLKEVNINNNWSRNSSAMAVTLTPPPDLVVDSIITPANIFSGQKLTITFQVENKGSGGTLKGVWLDRVYITKDSALNTSTATLIGSYNHNGILLPDSFYNRTVYYDIPYSAEGRHYVFVTTDYNNNIYEHASELNNTTRSDSITVILTPPPDLVVIDIDMPDTVANRETILVEWEVQNQGGSPPPNIFWEDRIYMSDSSAFGGTMILLGTQRNYSDTANILYPLVTYRESRYVNIPFNVSGKFYINVTTDYNNRVFEYNNEDNNTSRSDTTLQVLNPDIYVDHVTVPAVDSSGKTISVSWYDLNNGLGKIITAGWNDRIALSSYSIFHPDSVIILGYSNVYTELLACDSILMQAMVKLPKALSGNFYIYIIGDYNNYIFESVEGNNITRSDAMTVVQSPWPDLQVTSVTVPDTATAGDPVNLNINIMNFGQADAQGNWKDRIYIQKDSIFNSSKAIQLAYFNHVGGLQKDSIYTIQTVINLTTSLDSGNYYIFVRTDADNLLFEHTDENNNTGRSQSIYIHEYPPVDLAALSVDGADSAASGAAYQVDWDVKNIGQAVTLAPFWYDNVYLSTDSFLNTGNDIMVGTKKVFGPLHADSTYHMSQSFTIPKGLSGDYYLFVLADKNDYNNDDNFTNNKNTRRDQNGAAVPISISLTPPPDLQVATFTVPLEGTAGQPVTLEWTVINNGTGGTVVSGWTDRVYISSNFTLDNSDILFTTVVHSGLLNPADSYMVSKQAFLPNYLSGNYILIVATDHTNLVYEHSNEGNNTSAKPILINAQPPSDLIVTDFAVPQTGLAGGSATIGWEIKNIGVNPAVGVMRDAVYLSKDTIWDIDDALFGTYQGYINIVPQGTAYRQVTGKLSGVSIGDYFVIVKTDILDYIKESSDTNNTQTSDSVINITVKELFVNVLTPDTLFNNLQLYYKIEVPDTLNGETLLITLKGDSVNGSNELYYRAHQVPERNRYDYSHSDPFNGNQEVVVPELQEGTGYLMTYGSTVGPYQNIELFAEILQFEIRAVNSDKGGNSGKITVLISGSKLEANMVWRLTNGTDSIEAEREFFVDATKVYLTFDLKEMPLGQYDVVAVKYTDERAALEDGFEIISGGVADLRTNLNYPARTRPGQVVIISIEFTNAGFTDIDNGEMTLLSIGNAPIGFTVADLLLNQTSLQIPLEEEEGPPNVLRPGYNGTIVVYAKATSAMSFLIQLPPTP